MPNVREGDPIPLSLKLYDGQSNKYVRAFLTDSDGVALATSPADLSHVGNGLYENTNIIMPHTEHVTAIYIVYSDALYSVEDINYTHGTDLFELHVPDFIILDKIDYIIAKLSGLTVPGANITAHVLKTEIGAVVKDLNQIANIIKNPDVIASVQTDRQASSTIEDNDINATINCNKE